MGDDRTFANGMKAESGKLPFGLRFRLRRNHAEVRFRYSASIAEAQKS